MNTHTPLSPLAALRDEIRSATLRADSVALDHLNMRHPISAERRSRIHASATSLVSRLRTDTDPGLMELFLAEYGLSTDEGVALMCLAEALLRVPDAETIDTLIEDKIAPSAWSDHLGQSTSPLVNASTWALMLTGQVLRDGDGVLSALKGAVKRLGEPVIRRAVARAMQELGAQFVLGETIKKAVRNGRHDRAKGFTFSYDMLGEAALTAADAQAYFEAYADAITALGPNCTADDIRDTPGISVKLSALHPRYELGQKTRVMKELAPRLLTLCQMAADRGMGLNIDAEEADRLDLSLDVIERVLEHPSLAGWDGFGVVVQAYGKRAGPVIDWLYNLATSLDRRIMVRLVKGAYWDTEIKRAQVEGLNGFPVFTAKPATDVSYIQCAAKLLDMTDRIYPQFATHNAHTVCAILDLAQDHDAFEFQRLHGMGAALHDMIKQDHGTRCRIYAPVGPHRDLLAYLVRRLLENGANSSFVNQLVDEDVPPETVAADPWGLLEKSTFGVRTAADLFAPERQNSKGWDLHDVTDVDAFNAARSDWKTHRWDVRTGLNGPIRTVTNPALNNDIVGTLHDGTAADVAQAARRAKPWAQSPNERAAVLNRAADLYEQHSGELFALLGREAGKTPMDAIGEVREAVDFLRYYAAQIDSLADPARGIFACISPWNFPLAIFSGQIAAALAAGNGVIAKPADQTPLIAVRAVALLHDAGVPADCLQLIPGDGPTVGAALTQAALDGVCFTGSTGTALTINQAMATHMPPTAPLIAETGGLNAMIVDSTALPEQAVKDIVASAFQSAGQRCSALRVLYVQDDIADDFLSMLFGAMDELTIGNPWDLTTDVGPIIDAPAKARIDAHVAAGTVLHQLDPPEDGTFVAPTVLAVNGIGDLADEIFGPVLHVARFAASQLDQIIADINATGFGLTFGLHTRIDDRVEHVSRAVKVGNAYVNRNQIGAVVGSQPFGGEGLSGTGPKAGGPRYMHRFTAPKDVSVTATEVGAADPRDIQRALDELPRAGVITQTQIMPGPTGESNTLTHLGRGRVLCLGPGAQRAQDQAEIARAHGCHPVVVNDDLDPAALETLAGIDVVCHDGPPDDQRPFRSALAARSTSNISPMIPLVTTLTLHQVARLERHLCVDTTAAGGNASLLAEVGDHIPD